MHEQKRHYADEIHHDARHDRNRDICRHRRNPRVLAFIHHACRHTLLQTEYPDRTKSEHHNWISIEAIQELVPTAQGLVLGHGQCRDVAKTALIEISSGRMMDSMGTPPVGIWRQGQDTNDPPGPVVTLAMGEE